ncbi:MAG: hypothetical protein LPK26_03350 [Bacillaceae bacterium]|nr:hypothetical protein [Bacillaceae bacterium]
MRAKVYYDYYDGNKVPVWFVLNFGTGNLDWDEEYLYIPIVAPFEVHGIEDFDNEIFSASVTLGDLTVSHEKPNTIGVYLPRIIETITSFGGIHEDVTQFIIQVGDIEEILQMPAIRNHLEW